MAALCNDWQEALQEEFGKPYYKVLYDSIKREYETRKVFPPAEDIFNAFHYTSLADVKVVVLGQDPYHNDHQAHGLSFSVLPGVDVPPSLMNIYKELSTDMGCSIPNHGNLTKWAKQGVLLLNTVLTVRAHEANSHKNLGWETFTDAVIQKIDEKEEPVVFLLWGNPARAKKKLLHNPKHLILEAAHPSPLSAHRGFFGCKHFSQTNEFLQREGLQPIDWQIED